MFRQSRIGVAEQTITDHLCLETGNPVKQVCGFVYVGAFRHGQVSKGGTSVWFRVGAFRQGAGVQRRVIFTFYCFMNR